jgi:hypothetical protein
LLIHTWCQCTDATTVPPECVFSDRYGLLVIVPDFVATETDAAHCELQRPSDEIRVLILGTGKLVATLNAREAAKLR